MTNLPDAAEWVPVPQIETDTVWKGGPDGDANNQGKALTKRTAHLKALCELLGRDKQPLADALTALADIVTAADRLIYATGVNTFATTPLSAFIRTLLGNADAAAARTTLGALSQADLDALVNGAPGYLNQLNEFAAALGDDPNFAATVTNALAMKASIASVQKSESNLAIAAGTSDAITAAFTPAIAALTNGLMVCVKASAANGTTTPTLKVDGTAALIIVKGANRALDLGDIPGPDYWGNYQYNQTLNKWVMLNPATGVFGETRSFINKAINTDFNINQDSVSGGVVLAAGVYGHDGWKAGAGGCTYTFSSAGGITTISISAGTLLQVIEPSLVDSANVTTSWTGTAQGRVNAGGYASSPFSTAGLPLGSSYTIEFGTGTLTKVQTQNGSASPYERLSPSEAMLRCQWFYYLGGVGNGLDFGGPTNLASSAPNGFRFSIPHPSPMYQTPNITVTSQSQIDRANSPIAANSGTTRFHAVFQGSVAAGSGVAQWTNVKFKADCRL